MARVKVSDGRSRSRSHRADPADTDLVRVVVALDVAAVAGSGRDYDSMIRGRRKNVGAAVGDAVACVGADAVAVAVAVYYAGVADHGTDAKTKHPQTQM